MKGDIEREREPESNWERWSERLGLGERESERGKEDERLGESDRERERHGGEIGLYIQGRGRDRQRLREI